MSVGVDVAVIVVVGTNAVGTCVVCVGMLTNNLPTDVFLSREK